MWLWRAVALFLVYGRGGGWGWGRQVIGSVENDKGGVECTDGGDAGEEVEAEGGSNGGHAGWEETSVGY
jgi:hypothetical protein